MNPGESTALPRQSSTAAFGSAPRTAVEITHQAQAAVEADVDALIRTASLRKQDFGTDDQVGCLSRTRRWRVGAVAAIGLALGLHSGGAGIQKEYQRFQ